MLVRINKERLLLDLDIIRIKIYKRETERNLQKKYENLKGRLQRGLGILEQR